VLLTPAKTDFGSALAFTILTQGDLTLTMPYGINEVISFLATTL
jgi:hypothetical protein